MVADKAIFTLTQDSGIDQNKCVRMALVHDMGEAIIGDITPHDGVSKGTKLSRPTN
jgi:5'-deoxynucleotidase YfbR-like HD superfamily hydrolase